MKNNIDAIDGALIAVVILTIGGIIYVYGVLGHPADSVFNFLSGLAVTGFSALGWKKANSGNE